MAIGKDQRPQHGGNSALQINTRRRDEGISGSSSGAGGRRTNCNCGLLPHGPYILLPAILATIAWALSLVEDGCEFAKVSGDKLLGANGFDVVDGVDHPPPYLEIGFTGWRHPLYDSSDDTWKANVNGKCLLFPTVTVDRTNSETGTTEETTLFSPDMLMDTLWNVSKFMAFLSLVFGGGGALFLWFSSCCVFGPGSWKFAGYELLLATIFQSLGFLWFGTKICQNDNNSCSLYVGSRTDIMAAVLWFIAACSIFYKYPQPINQHNRDLVSPRSTHSGNSFSSIPSPASSTTTTPTPPPRIAFRESSGTIGHHVVLAEAEMVGVVCAEGDDDDAVPPIDSDTKESNATTPEIV